MNLQEIFLQVLKISLSASVAAGLVMLLRFCFRKACRDRSHLFFDLGFWSLCVFSSGSCRKVRFP